MLFGYAITNQLVAAATLSRLRSQCIVATLSRMNEEHLRFVCAYGMEMFHRRAWWDRLHSKYDIYICQILRGRLSHIHGNHRYEPS